MAQSIKMVAVMIIHFTYGWTKDFLNYYRNHMDKELIVFNNNPLPGQIVKKTRGFWGDSYHMNKLCQREISLVKNHPSVKKLINCDNSKEKYVEKLMTHGDVLDFMFPLLEQDYDAVILLEPDSVITGNQWWFQFEKKLKNYWIVGSNRMNNQDSVSDFCPSGWLLKEINSFIKERNLSFNKYGDSINTGQKIMRECFENMSYIQHLQGIKHIGKGSGVSNHFYVSKDGFCKMI